MKRLLHFWNRFGAYVCDEDAIFSACSLIEQKFKLKLLGIIVRYVELMHLLQQNWKSFTP